MQVPLGAAGPAHLVRLHELPALPQGHAQPGHRAADRAAAQAQGDGGEDGAAAPGVRRLLQ